MLSHHGRIELVVGPMFAGKTTELMRRVKREIHARRSCFVIKYAKDVRYDREAVASHDRMTLKAQAAVSLLADVADRWKRFDVVAVDEGQFFPDLVGFCNEAADAGKTVLVSALDGDYLRRPFGQICELVPYCESIDKLTAVCMMCHSCQASFTRRTVDSDKQELIGGAEMYIATCRQCYNKAVAPSMAAMRSVQQAIKEVEEACLGISGAKTKSLSDAGAAITAKRGEGQEESDGTQTPDSPDSPAVRRAASEERGDTCCPPCKQARGFHQPLDLDAPAARQPRTEG